MAGVRRSGAAANDNQKSGPAHDNQPPKKPGISKSTDNNPSAKSGSERRGHVIALAISANRAFIVRPDGGYGKFQFGRRQTLAAHQDARQAIRKLEFKERLSRNNANESNAWTKGKPQSIAGNISQHYDKHKHEFKFKNEKEYVRAAHRMLRDYHKDPGRFRYRDLPDPRTGDVKKGIFDPKTGTVLVATRGGIPKTLHVIAPKSATNPHGYDSSKFSSPLDYFLRGVK